MPQDCSNRFAEALSEYCRAHVLDEKWVLAPSLRVGHQWLECVARSGRPVLNARAKSLRSLAHELAAPDVLANGLSFLNRTGTQMLAARLFAHLPRLPDGEYLTGLAPSLSLIRTLVRSLEDLRLAGLTPEAMAAGAFEAPEKARELRELLSGYERELRDRRLVDYAGLLRLAASRASSVHSDVLIAAPEDLLEGLSAAERALWEAIPESQRAALEVDRPGSPRRAQTTDAALLSWLSDPAEAPPAKSDGTAALFRSRGEANEVREVLRRCLQGDIPFDEVELLYTEAGTYLPLIYEVTASPAEGDAIPATFAEGLPVTYSRPGRALLGWLSWQREGYPQATLAWMIQEGLLQAPSRAHSFSRLAAAFRAVPIGLGADRYLRCLDEAIAHQERRKAHRRSDREDEEISQSRLSEIEAGIDALNTVREMIAPLLEPAAQRDRAPAALLDAAKTFLSDRVRSAGELDSYARERLLREIADISQSLAAFGAPAVDIAEWLGELPGRLRVLGQGPRPGRLYAAPLSAGGHSGRSHTFVVGLDDGRYPGGVRQDPLLLDDEREAVSKDLPTALGRFEERAADLARVLARTRGSVTLSYCCRDLVDDRDLFPSPAVWSAYRILSGNASGAYEELLEWLPPPASFAPTGAESCLDMSDWWRWRLCGEVRVSSAPAAVAARYPHLARGFAAAQARASDAFTEYDGYVPEAGVDLDPRRPGAPPVSASGLELLGACPRDYFFHYALEIAPPEDLVLDPSIWLDPLERGSLLHEVFRVFMCRLQEDGLSPDSNRDHHVMDEILDSEVRKMREAKPPPSREIFERELRDLRQSAAIFLREEERHCGTWEPFCFEASIGLPGETESVLDTAEPISVTLPDGSSIRARARIDRVDRLRTDVSTLAVWDYKTGSTGGFEEADPFNEGRRIQNALYLMVTQARLQRLQPDCSVNSFGYFFPAPRRNAYGERMQWPADLLLTGGQDVLARLCRLIAAGCFPFSPKADDAKYSDYLRIHGDRHALAEQAARKLSNPQNAMLAPFRELRGL